MKLNDRQMIRMGQAIILTGIVVMLSHNMRKEYLQLRKIMVKFCAAIIIWEGENGKG